MIFLTYNEILFKFAGMIGTFALIQFEYYESFVNTQNINNPFISVGKLILEASDITKRLGALSQKQKENSSLAFL